MQSPAIEYFFKAKWPEGFCCPRCGHNHAYEITSRKQPLYQCSKCRHQTSLTAGTVMEESRTPLEKWYIALQLIAEPGGINAVQLMHVIGVTYKTAWSMLKKVREAISSYDRNQQLSGTVRAEMTFYGRADRMSRRRHPKEQSCVIMAEFLTDKQMTGLVPMAASNEQLSGAVVAGVSVEQPTEIEDMCISGEQPEEIDDAGVTEKQLAESSTKEQTTPKEALAAIDVMSSSEGQEDFENAAAIVPVVPSKVCLWKSDMEQCHYLKLKVANPAYMHNRVMPQVLQPMFLAKHVDSSIQTGIRIEPLIPLHGFGETPMLIRLAQQAKDSVNRTYRGIGPKYLQRYWDEFCFRFNMTRFSQPVLDVLAKLCMNSGRKVSIFR